MIMCVCVLTNEDIHLYNDMGMTRKGDLSGHWPMSPLFKNAYKSYRVSFLGKVEMHSLL